MSNFQLIESKRGKPVILYSGYKLNFKVKNKNLTIRWICAQRSCPGAVVTDEKVTKIVNEKNHTCVPDIAKNEVENALYSAKKRARDETTPIPTIFREEVMNITDAGLEFVTNVPDFSSVKTALYKKRHEALGIKQLPKNRKEIVIPDQLKHLILIDDGEDQNRMLVFANPSSCLLEQGTEFFVDGTFSSCCPLFKQLYTIHVDIGSTQEETNIIPAVFALLPDKQQTTYRRLFGLLREKSKFVPKKIHIDFEKAAINAVNEEFPDAIVKGCNFHYNQALWRKVQEIGLVCQYKNDREIRDHVRMCAALAHIPEIFLTDAWLDIMSTAPEDDKILLFNDYFVKQWLEAEDLIWICYGERHRTTNAVEGWHNRFNKRVGKVNPNIYEFLKVLEEEINYYHIIKQKNYMHMNTPKRAKKYVHLDDRINKILNDLLENKSTIRETLLKLSYAVRLD